MGANLMDLHNEGLAIPTGGIASKPLLDLPKATKVVLFAMDLGQDMTKVDLRGPLMFSEDFAFMLEEVPGCYFGIGNGPGKSLHDTGYDFNDDLLVPGTAVWARLVEKVLAAR